MNLSHDSKPARAPKPVMTVVETRVPSWYLFLFFPMLASLLLFLLATPPMPLWLRAAGHAGWAAPAIVFVLGLGLLFSKQFSERKRASPIRNFTPADPAEVKDAQAWIREFTRRVSRDSVRRVRTLHGTYRGRRCEHITATIGRGRHWYTCSITTVRTDPAPVPVWFARRTARWNPSITRPRFKLGPPDFRSRWDVAGDRETADFLLTQPVIEALQSGLPSRAQAWCWSGDRLAILLPGLPTAHGIKAALDAVVHVADEAAVLSDDPDVQPG